MSAEHKKRGIAEFFAREKENLIRFVRGWIDDTAERDSEDIVQDVMVGIFERADITKPIENLSSYIYRSLYNRIVDIYRKGKRTVSLDVYIDSNKERTLSDVFADVRYDVHDEVQRKEIRHKIFSAIDQLSPKLKAVLIATEFEGRSYKELSQELNIPIGTLLSHKYRAIQKIRSMLNSNIQNGKEKHNDE
jgi:RNA polymerase sigma factor (sigma-70 family)